MRKIDEKQFVEVCSSVLSMAEASVKLGLHFNTFKKYAIKLGCYKPNPSGKGKTKNHTPKIDLQEILDGKHPSFQTNKLRKRLIKEGLKKNECEICGIKDTWNDKPITIELDHINGIRSDHRWNNLRMSCPNCHSQTPTFRSKNIK